MIHDDILGTIHDTSLVRVRLAAPGTAGEVVAALSAGGTAESTADAVARRALDDLEATGALASGSVLVACGANFGASVAMIAAARRRACVVVVNDDVPLPLRNRITAYGAELRVLPLHGGDEDLTLAARRVTADTPSAVLVEKRRAPGRGERDLAAWLLDACGDALHTVIGTARDAAVLEAVREAAKPHDVSVLTLEFDGVTWVAATPSGPLLVSERDALLTARRVAADQGLLGDPARGGATLAAAARIARDAPDGARVVAFVPAADDADLRTAFDRHWWESHHGGETPSLTAADILAQKDEPIGHVVTLEHDETVADAIRIMRDLEVSQIPVVRDDQVVGTIREDQVIDLLLHANDRKDGPVSSVMEDPLPQIDESASVDELQTILVRGGSAVIVRRANGGRDILTKYDLIHALTRA